MASNINFRPSDELEAWLEDRSRRVHDPVSKKSNARRARIELDLWRAMLATELARHEWTLNEIGLIAEVMQTCLLNDSIGDPIGIIALEVSEAFQDGDVSLGAKWEVDEEDLLQRLIALNPVADMALADAISRYWALPTRTHSLKTWTDLGMNLKVS